MKISRSSYFILFAFFLMFLSITIGQFSEEAGRQTFLPFLIGEIVLVIIGIVVAIKDREFIRIRPDERTRKVDRSAGYYSWWFTFLFIFVFGIVTNIRGFTINQFIAVVLTEMYLTIILFHMYFYFKGEE